MAKYEEEYEVTEAVLSQLLKVHGDNAKWTDDNTLSFTVKKENVGKIVLSDKKITVTGSIDKEFKELLKIVKDSVKNVVKQDKMENTPFQGMHNELNKYGGLEKYPALFDRLVKMLKKLGVHNLTVNKDLRQDQTIMNKLSLAICTSPQSNSKSTPSGYYGRLRTFLFDTYKGRYKTKESIDIRETSRFRDLEGEKAVEIKIEAMTIGYYYPERNFIQLMFNPFMLFKQSIFEDTVPPIFLAVFKALTDVGVKQIDVSDIQEKIFVSEYMGKSRDRLAKCEDEMKAYTRDVKSYEEKIRARIETYNEKHNEALFIKSLIDNNGKGLFAEVNKMSGLPFVDKVDIEGATIDIKYKPTFMPIPDMKRNDSGKGYGKRFIWVGAIGFRITPNGFEVYGDVNMRSHCHPHGGGFPSGSPCFGSGDGRNKIYELLAANQFEDLAKMLWFWIKTFKNGGAYVKVWDAYDYVLKQGYPVYDDKGVRIVINDPVRIKSGEQVKLTKDKNFSENEKKFGKVKLVK